MAFKQPHSAQSHSEFGQKLHALRQQNKLSMRALARQIDLSQSYVSKLESGDRKPSRDVVIKLAQAFWPEKNNKAQDELLVLAGFLPEDPQYLAQTLDESTQLKQNWQQAPQNLKHLKRYLVHLIKARNFETAQNILNSSFQHFQNSVVLQSLIAFLELSKQNYDQALTIQAAALQQYPGLNNDAQADISEADLIYDLGEIYFFKAYYLLGLKYEADRQNKKKQARDYHKESKLAFQAAHTQFKSALKIDPENIHYLEEYARVSFNLADISPPKAAQAYWQTTITSYRKLLVKDTQEALGEQRSREIGLFLAHAYTKTQNFEQAELLLDAIGHYCPKYAFLYYVKACLYSLWYEQEQGAQLDKALDAIQQTLRFSDSRSETQQQILNEPDLTTLRRERAKDFELLLA